MFCPIVKLIEFPKVSAAIGNDYRHNSVDRSFVEGPTIFFFRFCLRLQVQIFFLMLMINSRQLYRTFKEVKRPTCYYEGREGGRAHVGGDDQNPTIYVFRASQLPDNLYILPSSKVPSCTVTRP